MLFNYVLDFCFNKYITQEQKGNSTFLQDDSKSNLSEIINCLIFSVVINYYNALILLYFPSGFQFNSYNIKRLFLVLLEIRQGVIKTKMIMLLFLKKKFESYYNLTLTGNLFVFLKKYCFTLALIYYIFDKYESTIYHCVQNTIKLILF